MGPFAGYEGDCFALRACHHHLATGACHQPFFHDLSRMRKRMSEIGVRKAFGATGSELVRQVFFENLLLSLLAGMLGLALSYGATFLLNGFLFGNSANAYLNGDTSLTPGMLLSPWAFLSAFGFCLR